ncbi:E3 ubiquitin-protein ligase EL5-like [Panicum virgatum]|uniref:RING-type E3 ubiquitin transferase n=1 Tax=Panicum virgatum TaxID=38727 RepID=A0A8T0X170_PANVG|nr:E3 ubiquitin-protein ligase EL5-like [Panicum virgatum]KAG2651636.1 hypothetical protein PVAP13_1NG294900 [Panicum virgatum]
MAHDSDQGAARPSRRSGGDVAADAPAPPKSAAAGAMTLGSIFTVAGIVLVFVVFAIVLLSLQYCFNAWDRGELSEDAPSARRRRRHGGSGRGIRARTRGGVDPELLRSLPVTVYRAAAAGSKGAEEEGTVECAVCLAELEDGEAARFLPRCGHGFHAECVDTWLASHTTCPLCRLTVAKPDAPPCSALLPPVPPEPASYAASTLPASVLLGVPDQGAGTMATDGDAGASTGATGALAIQIPEPAVPAPAPPNAAKSPGSARLRSSFRRLWSFGRQGAGASSSCSCAGAGEGADLEQGVSVTTDRQESRTNLQSSL